jgi:hypothetical protein
LRLCSWGTAESIMYSNIVTKAPGKTTLKELMDSDLDGSGSRKLRRQMEKARSQRALCDSRLALYR